jgi:hypothetical protein
VPGARSNITFTSFASTLKLSGGAPYPHANPWYGADRVGVICSIKTPAEAPTTKMR